MAESDGGNLNLSQLRNLVRQFIDIHLYDSALFWADKVCSLSKNNPQDVLWLSHSLFLTKQPLRAAQLLKSQGLTSTSSVARYMAAKCYVECKEWKSALETLEGEDQELKVIKSQSNLSCPQEDTATSSFSSLQVPLFSSGGGIGGSRKIEAAISLLKGIIYESLENREIAAQCFKDALQHDVYCFEAFNLLVSHHGLTASEEGQLVESLPYTNQCSDEESKLIKFVYKCKTNKYAKPIDEKLPTNLEPLADNLDYIVSMAERHFNNSNYREAYEYVKYVLKIDRLHEGCLPLYISCLSVLKKKNDLYNVAHELVNTYPGKSVSWYAIGTYYLLINKNESARKYFSKATTIDNAFGPAWLGFAHSFASEGERDQAISAYFSASQYMPGSHLPFLYLGLEYSLSHDIKLAKKFYKEALAISPNDPHIKLELGTLAYENGEYEKAEMHLTECMNQIQLIESNVTLDIWEPLYNNLGHASRKLKKYNEAVTYHEHAYLLNPKDSGTCSSIGLCYMLMDEYAKAVSILHIALSLKRDDTISIQLLNEALKNLSSEITTDNGSNLTESLINIDQTQLTNPNSSNQSQLDLSCTSKSLSWNNSITTDKSAEGEQSAMELEYSSRMSLEMSDIGTPM